MTEHKIVVIGGGPAGMAAAVAAYDSGITDVVIIDREEELGGILRQCIHNGFGLHKLGQELTGPEYADVYKQKVLERGIKVYSETMVTDLTADRIVTAQNRQGILKIKAGAVVLAMGCRERSRGALNICGTRPAGIYSAGTAQKFINCLGYSVGKKVVILGSGDIGLIMARRMTLQGAKVLACVELMPYSSGLNRNIVQCLQDYDIPLYLSHTVTDIRGRERLEGVTVSEVDEKRNPIPGTEIEFDCDTLLLSCGLIPENELSLGAGVEISPATSGAVVNESFETSVPGIFACGNVLHVHDLVDHVSNESFKAGAAAAAYVRNETRRGSVIAVRDGDGVRGTVPQQIRSDTDQPVDLMFRPSAVFRNSSVVVESGAQELIRKKAMIFTPGEMALVTLRPEMLKNIGSDSITVRIERN